MRRTGIIKVGAAAVAAGAGVILALTSVMAHTSQTAALHVPSKSAVASIMTTFEAKQNAAEAAALLASEQNRAAKLAAKLKHDAAVAAEEAAESSATEAAEQAAKAAAAAAAAACKATDQPEDTAERAADAAEDAAETPGANDQAEDTAERAADAAEDATEVPCGNGEHPLVVVKHGASDKPGSGGAHGDH